MMQAHRLAQVQLHNWLRAMSSEVVCMTKIVLKHEHLAACAKRCRAEQRHVESLDDLSMCYHDIAHSIEVFNYRGDATNQEAIQHEKVHTNLLASMVMHSAGGDIAKSMYDPVVCPSHSSVVSQMVHYVNEAGDFSGDAEIV